MIYLYLKWIHIISSTLLFGTGIGSAFYLLQAHLSKDDHAIAFASRNIVLADWIFIMPTVIIQPISGLALMLVVGYTWSMTWIWLSLILFLITGACWLPAVWLQIQIKNLAISALKTGSPLYENQRYQKYIITWFCLGWPAFAAMLGIFYLMVFKTA